MDGAAHFPGGSSNYIAGSMDLVIGYSRNPEKYPYLQYTQILDIPDGKDITHFLKFGRNDMVRLAGGDDKQYNWVDGDERPNNHNNDEFTNWKRVKAERKSFGFQLGTRGADMASWNVRGIKRSFAASRAITSRVLRVHKELEKTTNWDSSHRADVTSFGTGRWDQSTTARSDIKRSINRAWETIELSTNSAIDQKDFVLVMNTKTAAKIGESQEMINALVQSPEARNHFEGQGYNPAGLTGYLYGYPVIIENSVLDESTRNHNDNSSKRYICADNVVYMLARPGTMSMDASEGPSFSTVGIFMKEDMTDQSKEDEYHRLEEGAITDDCRPKMLSEVAGFRFENVAA